MISSYLRTFILCFFLFLLACTSEKKETKKKAEVKGKSGKLKSGLVKTYHSNGNVRAEIMYDSGIKNGLAKDFYEDGVIHHEIEYKRGKKNGLAKMYHKNGNLFQSTEYLADEIHGNQTKYREDGKLASIARYSNGTPCTGLKEYTLDGALKKKYPTIVVTPINNLLKDNKYLLRLSMSDKTRAVEYFTGSLTKEGCLGDDAQKIWTDATNGVVDIVYYLPVGGFIMEKVNIIAKVKTLQGNFYLTQRSYNVAIENN